MVGDDSPFARAEELVGEGEELLGAGVVVAAVVDAGVGDCVAAVDDSGDLSGADGVASADRVCRERSRRNAINWVFESNHLGHVSGCWFRGLGSYWEKLPESCGGHVSCGAGWVCH